MSEYDAQSAKVPPFPGQEKDSRGFIFLGTPEEWVAINLYNDAVYPSWHDLYYLGEIHYANRAGDWWQEREAARRSGAHPPHATAVVSSRYGPAQAQVCLTCMWVSTDLEAIHEAT